MKWDKCTGDQLLFESVVNQTYLYLPVDPQFYKESMLAVSSIAIAILRWRLWKGLATVHPVHILTPTSFFYQVQEAVILLLFHQELLKDRMIIEIEVKVKELRMQVGKEEVTGLLTICLYFLGVEEVRMGKKLSLDRLKMFKLHDSYSDIVKDNRICEQCSR